MIQQLKRSSQLSRLAHPQPQPQGTQADDLTALWQIIGFVWSFAARIGSEQKDKNLHHINDVICCFLIVVESLKRFSP